MRYVTKRSQEPGKARLFAWSAVPPRLLSSTFAALVGTAALAWYIGSALIPVEWPSRWFLIFTVPVALSWWIARRAKAAFLWARWVLTLMASLVSVVEATALVLAVGAVVVSWPHLTAIAHSITNGGSEHMPGNTAKPKAKNRKEKNR